MCDPYIRWILQLSVRKKDYVNQNSSYLCCINTQENCLITWNKLRNQFQIYQICKKNCKMSPFDKTNKEYKIFGHFRFITIFDNFISFAKSGRPISTLLLPFLDQ